MSVIGPVQSWNRKQNKVCVTLDSELYRRKPVLTYAISGNVVGASVNSVNSVNYHEAVQ